MTMHKDAVVLEPISDEEISVMKIAINRSWIWMQEYDPHTGQVGTKDAPYINECRHAFIDGFVEGFNARIFGEKV